MKMQRVSKALMSIESTNIIDQHIKSQTISGIRRQIELDSQAFSVVDTFLFSIRIFHRTSGTEFISFPPLRRFHWTSAMEFIRPASATMFISLTRLSRSIVSTTNKYEIKSWLHQHILGDFDI